MKLIDDLNKKYGENVIRRGSEVPPVRAFPFGLPTLDIDLGGGALWGRQFVVAGEEATGKTTLCYMAVAQAQLLDIPNIYWFDLEKSFDAERAKIFGVDPELIHVVRGELTAEIVFAMLRDLARAVKKEKDSRALFVVDSVAAIESEALFEKESSAQFGGSARMINQSLRVWNAVLGEDQILLLINQLRVKMGMGEPFLMPGGMAQLYVPSHIVWLRDGLTLKDGTTPIGKELRWTLKKSRSSSPKEVGSAQFLFETGFDYNKNTLDAAIELKLIEQSGPWYQFGEDKFKGKDALFERLNSDPTFFTVLKTNIYQQMKVPIWDGR